MVYQAQTANATAKTPSFWPTAIVTQLPTGKAITPALRAVRKRVSSNLNSARKVDQPQIMPVSRLLSLICCLTASAEFLCVKRPPEDKGGETLEYHQDRFRFKKGDPIDIDTNTDSIDTSIDTKVSWTSLPPGLVSWLSWSNPRSSLGLQILRVRSTQPLFGEPDAVSWVKTFDYCVPKL